MRQTADLNGGARWQGREIRHAGIHVAEELVDVRDVRRGLHDVVPRRIGRFQRRFDILTDLANLGFHIALADDIARHVPGHLAGDENQAFALNRNRVGVEEMPAHHTFGQGVGMKVLPGHIGILLLVQAGRNPQAI